MTRFRWDLYPQVYIHWHEWFAWYPIWLPDKIVWLRRIRRRCFARPQRPPRYDGKWIGKYYIETEHSELPLDVLLVRERLLRQ